MSATRACVLRWGKNLYDVDVGDVTGLEFKKQVEKVTFIPVNKQNIICNALWKGFLQDSYQFSVTSIPDYCSFILIASTNASVATISQDGFAENLPESEAREMGLLAPVGLLNLVNTCYANSVIQVLHRITELKEGLNNYGATDNPGGTPGALVQKLRDTFNELDKSSEVVRPFALINEVRRSDVFGHRERGLYQQQDAEEFCSYLLGAVAATLPTHTLGHASNIVDDLFKLKFRCTYTCPESGESLTTEEDMLKLYCSIRGGANEEVKVNFMAQGLKLGLESDVERHSDVLGRTALWKKSMQITSLPKYLCVQFMRFYWKELPESREGGIACKIMRAVEFPFRFDIREFCADEVKQSIDVVRNTLESDQYQEYVKDYIDNQELKDGILQSLLEDASVPTSSPAPAGFAGFYELVGIVSHMGDSLKGGHYVGWVKNRGKWFKCDDDKVNAVTKHTVRQLKGGSEAHSAYLCFYRYVDSNA